MTLPNSFLTDDLTVETVEDGRVAVTVLLPPDLVSHYCKLLDSLHDFFRVVDRKKSYTLSEDRVRSPEAKQQAKRFHSEYRDRIAKAFDKYIDSGLDYKEATKRVASDLRSDNHPWSASHLVKSELVAIGRGGRSGRPRKSSEADHD
jgi:hypothetical protein